VNLLALDTATVTGWAVNADGKVHTSGAVDFSLKPTSHPGHRFNWYADWLGETIRDFKISLISYEAVVGGRKAGGKTSLVQKGLEAITYQIAARCDEIPVWSFSAATIKKWATGNGQLTHESKQLMVRTALKAFPDQHFVPHRPTKSQPWAYDDNQCDALWLQDLTHQVRRIYTDNEEPMNLQDLDNDRRLELAQYLTKQKWLSRGK